MRRPLLRCRSADASGTVSRPRLRAIASRPAMVRSSQPAPVFITCSTANIVGRSPRKRKSDEQSSHRGGDKKAVPVRGTFPLCLSVLKSQEG